tara:strand:- start:153 stop:260 length:108 start_codon:yes stop_codon:yes gene_type:complete
MSPVLKDETPENIPIQDGALLERDGLGIPLGVYVV